ncbi:MAG TPA: hypothetical protein VFR53_07410 [Methylomirabilota bacterium]|nr:hypothetical protein [Methylomirabilota bacterium]
MADLSEVELHRGRMLTPLRALVKRASVRGRARDRIGAVTPWRLLVLATLVYVALDLSLPAMPGAFVFEPEGSAEGTRFRAARADAETPMLPTQVRAPASALFQVPLDGKERLAPVAPAETRGRPVVHRRSPAPLDSAPASEDPL